MWTAIKWLSWMGTGLLRSGRIKLPDKQIGITVTVHLISNYG